MEAQYCEMCNKAADNPLCAACLNWLFDDYDKDELPEVVCQKATTADSLS